ncbi:MAG: anthranilate phosphoribosyltransferase [Rickettsiales bacterium]|nr:anthranilate phosphoribosyltransferase [Rickettsiales bacterium]
MSLIQNAIEKLSCGIGLEEVETQDLFLAIINGGVTPAQIASILTALRVKGESPIELIGATKVMRAKMQKLQIDKNLQEKIIDTCGTGGDNKGTYNISTAVAIVVSSCGVPVAKHGNRSVSSLTGSADVLKELDVNIELTPEQSASCLEQIGLCFLFAPLYHKALASVSSIRKELGIKTIFNLLGPLSNPAQPVRQMMGVFARKFLPIIAEAGKELGYKHLVIVHGKDGSDEISITGSTYVCELIDGKISSYEINPQDFGLKVYNEDEIIGGNSETNAKALRDCLKGIEGAYLDSVLINSAMALKVSGRVENLEEGIKIALASIKSGNALKKLDRLVEISNSFLI